MSDNNTNMLANMMTMIRKVHERKMYLLSGHNVKGPQPKMSDVTKRIQSSHKAIAT